MRVAVAGASGFIGSHLIARILAITEWDVVAVSRRPVNWGPRVQSIQADLRWCSETLPTVDAIVNMASSVNVAEALRNPRETILSNTAIALGVAEWASRSGTPLVVHVTTAEVFGPGGPHLLREPINPTNPYAASKAAQDAIFQSSGLNVVTARTQNVFGERQDPAKFVPTVVRLLKAGEPVTLFGDAYRRHIHADDVADNLIRTVQHPADVNVTGADLISNRAVVRMIANRLGVRPTVDVVDEFRPGHEAVYDLAPTDGVTDDLETGLDKAVGWFTR